MDRELFNKFIRKLLEIGGYSIIVTGSTELDRVAIIKEAFDIAVVDITVVMTSILLPGDITGLRHLDEQGEEAYCKPLWLSQNSSDYNVLILKDFYIPITNKLNTAGLLFDLVLDHKVEKHGKLKKNTLICMMMEKEEVDTLDPSLIDKFIVLNLSEIKDD